MVWFAEDNELKNSKDPFETLDPPPPDFSFADSLLDFDSIQHWFDANSSADTPPLHDDTTKHTGLVTLSDTIEEGIGKISLAGGSEKPLGTGGNATQCQVLAGEGESLESESSSTSSSSSPSSTSSASSSSSDSVGHGDDDNVERKHSDKKREVISEELEEGEIREEVEDDEEVEEDVEKMISWSDEDEYDDASGGPIRSKNEMEALPPVPQVDVTLEPQHEMLPVGIVTSIMGAKVIVEGLEKHEPLDEGSILWMHENRTPLGFVDEVFGPVRNPYYVVRYNSENEVPTGVYDGASISFVPDFANLVLNMKDLYEKGYDASGANDEEITHELEFSDDEKEAEHGRIQKLTKRGINDKKPKSRKANRKKVPVNSRAMPLLNQANCPTLPFPFPPTSLNPHMASNGIQTSELSLPHPQLALLSYGLPANGATWFSQNPRNNYHQLPAPEIAFQHQFNSSQGSISANMFGGGVFQPNAPGLVGQPPNFFGEQSILYNQMQFQGNHNLRPGSVSGNSHFSADRGRKTSQRGGSRDW